MIREYTIPLESRSEWNEALKGLKHSFALTWDNCYAMNLTTGYKTFLYCFEEDGIRVVCPYSERNYGGYTDIVTPFGFSGFTGNGNCETVKESWFNFMKEKKYVCGYISMNPVFENESYYKQEEAYQTTRLHIFDLTKSLTELFDNLNSNRKKQIKNYRSMETKFIYDKKKLIEFFIDNYTNFLERVNASSANYFSRETLEYLCSLENVFIVGAGEENKVEAVYIFLYTKYIGDCMFNISTEAGKKYASYLFWCGLKYFRSKKIPLLNLGAGVTSDDNLDQSKERFGGMRYPFKSLKQIYDSSVYQKLCVEKGIKASDLSGYFPLYRKE